MAGCAALSGRALQRSRAIENRADPGARGSKAWDALGSRLTRHRVAVAAAGPEAGCVMRRHGVAVSPAARLRRRAGVRPTSSMAPMTRARLCALRPSSIAFKASLARAVSTMMRRDGASPRRANPAADGEPNSAARQRGQHHRTQGRGPAPLADPASASTRRTARRPANPIPAIQSAADAPSLAEGTPLISWRAFVSSPAGRSASEAGQPSRQPGSRNGREALSGGEAVDPHGPRRGACRSRLRMRERSPSMTASLTESGGGIDTADGTLSPKGPSWLKGRFGNGLTIPK